MLRTKYIWLQSINLSRLSVVGVLLIILTAGCATSYDSQQQDKYSTASTIPSESAVLAAITIAAIGTAALSDPQSVPSPPQSSNQSSVNTFNNNDAELARNREERERLRRQEEERRKQEEQERLRQEEQERLKKEEQERIEKERVEAEIEQEYNQFENYIDGLF